MIAAAPAPRRLWASFSQDNFRITQGQPREVEWVGRLRSFCPQCGTPLTFRAERDAEEIDVTVCSFDHPEHVMPRSHVWVEDRLSWIYLADNLPAHRQSSQGSAPP